MSLVLDLGFLLVAAAVAYAAVRDRRSGSRKRAEPRRGDGTGSDGASERLAGLLSAWTGQTCRVYPYWLGRMDSSNLSEEERGLRFAIDGLCPTVTLWRHGFPAPMSAASIVPIGDAQLEQALRACGPAADVHALLTAATRSTIHGLLRGAVRVGQIQLEGGTLTLDVPTGGFAREHPGLEPAARAFAALAAGLKAPPSLAQRLRENLADDPMPEVRLWNLRALLDAFGGRTETRVAAVEALRDGDASVRLEAAIAAKAQGRDTLVALAIDPAVAPGVSIRALDALGSNLPLDRVEPLVREAARERLSTSVRSGRVQAFIAALGRHESRDALGLLERLAGEAHDSNGVLVVRAIATGRWPGAEGALIRALVGSGPLTFAMGRSRTQDAIVRTLGDVGTADSIPPLRAAAQRYGGAMAAAARRSVAAIQERLAGTKGRLALSDAEAGRLSDAEGASGRVSLPDED